MWNVTGKGRIASLKTGLGVCYLVFTCLLFGCQKKDSIDTIECNIISSFDQYPDSSYFKEISCIYYKDTKLYLFDKTRGDVAVKDLSKNTFYTVGKIGQGPSEVSSPTSFTVFPNGNIAILDEGSLSLKVFNKSGFISSSQVPSATENRFFVYENNTYLTLATDTSCYVKVTPYWKRGRMEGIELCGNIFHITKALDMNLIRNRRHLVKTEKYLYAVSPSYPVIEKYELNSDKLLETYDLSEIDCIGDIWSFICKESLSPKSFYIFLKDVYYAEGKLYILYANWEKKYSVNHILVLDTQNQLTPICIYKLPGNIYTSFAVHDTIIYAMNYEKNEIQTIRSTISL